MRKKCFVRIAALLLFAAMCVQLSGCAKSLEEKMNAANQTLSFHVDSIYWYECDVSPERTRFVWWAMQVPYGEVRYAYYAQKYLSGPFSKEDIVGFTVSFAAMLPSNTTLNEDTVVPVFQAARKCFDEKGIPVYFSEVYALEYGCFFVFASATQMQEVICDDSAALYVGLSGYPEKSTLREFYGAEGKRPETPPISIS